MLILLCAGQIAKTMSHVIYILFVIRFNMRARFCVDVFMTVLNVGICGTGDKS